MQKRKYIIQAILIVTTIVVFVACKKEYPGDSYDFSNSLSAYVEFKKGVPPNDTVLAKAGGQPTATILVRTSIQDSITVNYTLSGSATGTGTIGISRNAKEGSVKIPVPGGAPVGSTIKVKMTAATTTKGVTLGLGRTGVDKDALVIKVIP